MILQRASKSSEASPRSSRFPNSAEPRAILLHFDVSKGRTKNGKSSESSSETFPSPRLALRRFFGLCPSFLFVPLFVQVSPFSRFRLPSTSSTLPRYRSSFPPGRDELPDILLFRNETSPTGRTSFLSDFYLLSFPFV